MSALCNQPKWDARVVSGHVLLLDKTRTRERLTKICYVLISSHSSYEKEFKKNSNLLRFGGFFEVPVVQGLILIDDYSKFMEENLEKYWYLEW